MNAKAVPFPPIPFPEPIIRPGERNFRFLLEDGRMVDGYLRRRSPDHREVYTILRDRKPIRLGPRGAKGIVLYAMSYLRIGSRYRETHNFVVIKKLRLDQIQGAENPGVEISAAQMIGDDEHVVSIRDALQDDKYLYIVTPYYGSDILQALYSGSQPNVPVLLETLIRNLVYLQQHCVIHRDVSPENITIHRERDEECCPLIDFAMALQCAKLEGNPQRVTPQTPCGKMAYMSPEVYTGRELGFGIDMWALGCILFVIWTHHRLYDSVGDRCYQFFIQEGGLEMSDDDLNIDYWMAVPGLPPDYLPILDRLPRVHEMTFNQRSLLAQMLRIDPSQRIQPQDVLNHPWFQEQLQQL